MHFGLYTSNNYNGIMCRYIFYIVGYRLIISTYIIIFYSLIILDSKYDTYNIKTSQETLIFSRLNIIICKSYFNQFYAFKLFGIINR